MGQSVDDMAIFEEACAAAEATWSIPSPKSSGVTPASYCSSMSTGSLHSAAATISGTRTHSQATPRLPFPRLLKLCLQNNRISKIPKHMGQLELLTDLDMRENRIAEIPTSLAELTNLKKLNLANNRIRSLPPDFFASQQGQLRKHFPNLTLLNLGANLLSELPPGITNLRCLKDLVFGGNFQFFQKHDRLISFSLFESANRFTDIPKEIYEYTTLCSLNFSWNQISTIDPAISQMRKLTHLCLSGNMLTSLPDELGKLKSLAYCYLASNNLATLPDSFSDLKGIHFCCS